MKKFLIVLLCLLCIGALAGVSVYFVNQYFNTDGEIKGDSLSDQTNGDQGGTRDPSSDGNDGAIDFNETGVYLTRSSYELEIGQGIELIPVYSQIYTDYIDIVWTCSNHNVLSYSVISNDTKTCYVYAIGVGRCQMTITAFNSNDYNYYSASADFVVTDGGWIVGDVDGLSYSSSISLTQGTEYCFSINYSTDYYVNDYDLPHDYGDKLDIFNVSNEPGCFSFTILPTVVGSTDDGYVYEPVDNGYVSTYFPNGTIFGGSIYNGIVSFSLGNTRYSGIIGIHLIFSKYDEPLFMCDLQDTISYTASSLGGL